TIKDHNEYGILSPLHLNGNGDKLDGGFANYAGPEYTDGLLSDLSLSKVSDVYESRFVNAAAWLVSKKCLETVGGFDPIFFHYGEDYNYCQRVHYHDLKVGIVPAVKIYHDREYKQQAYESEQIFRHYLITVADINNDHYLRDKKKLYRQDKIRMISSLLRRDLKRFRQNRNNIKLKRKFFPEVLESRKKNIKGGPVYIS
ncbi:MAG: glycosyltransferase family 2 protein, partial [Bacteroidota bacterium]